MANKNTNPPFVSLAILPFENLTEGNQLEIYCKSFCIDLITELSKFRQFQIISYSRANGLLTHLASESKLPAIDTDYFITGSFRNETDRIWVNVQLFETKSNRLIWADRFEQNLDKVQDLQDELYFALVATLKKQLNYDLLSQVHRKEKINLKAYEYWLYGFEELKKGTLENDLKARSYFQQAIDIEPGYSLAYSGMSLTYFNEWSCQLWERWEVSQNGAFEWARKAIELDEQNYVASYVLGRIFLYDGAYETAEHFLRKSLRLNANDPESLIQIAVCFMYLGYGNEAFKLYEKALLLNPEQGYLYFPIGAFILIEQEKYNEALALARKAKNIPYVDGPAYIATAWFHLGEYDKMMEYWQQFLNNYSKIVNRGKPATTEEAVQWMNNVNPFRQKSKTDALWEYLSNGKSVVPSSGQSKIKTQYSGPGIFRKQEDFWEFTYEEKMCRLAEVKGFHDLQILLSQPLKPIHCAELMDIRVTESGEPVFDQKAKDSYQAKLLDLQKEIELADLNNDFEQLSTLQEEYDEIIEHLSKSLGLNGNIRKAGNPVEKARSAVTWRIRSAISKIEQAHPSLGKHLSNSVQTGTFCSYEPERDVEWII